jgi:hypothetical protein
MTVDELIMKLGEGYRHANVALMIGPPGSEAFSLETVTFSDDGDDGQSVLLAAGDEQWHTVETTKIQNDDFGSPSRVTAYEIVRGGTFNEVQAVVTTKLSQGWQPFGPLVIGNTHIAQAMVKYKEK